MEEHIIYKKDSVVSNAFNFNLNLLDRLDIPYVSLLKMRNLFWGVKRHFIPLMWYLYLVLFRV